MDHPGRFDWDFIPKCDRTGIPIVPAQLPPAHARSDAAAHGPQHARLHAGAPDHGDGEHPARARGRSARAYRPATSARRTSTTSRWFGRPSFEDTWGWRFLGHHLSLSYTIVGQRWLSVTPCNMGAQPAEMGVLSPLRADEELGFEILHGLPDGQRKQAVIHHVAPADYTTRQVPRVGKVEYPDYLDLGISWYQINDEDREALKFEKNNPRGIAGSDMPADQARTPRRPRRVVRRPDARRGRERHMAAGQGRWSRQALLLLGRGQQERARRTTTASRAATCSSSSTTRSTTATTSTRCGVTTAPTSGTQLLLDHYEHERHHGHHLDTRSEVIRTRR